MIRLRTPRTAKLLIGALVVVALLYASTIGIARPVDDFEPESPAEPTVPSQTPVAYATFSYLAVVDGLLAGEILQFDPHVAPYISPEEGRVYEKRTLVSWSPDPPPPPESLRASIHIKVWGSGGNQAPQVWQSEWTTLTISELPAELSGESGRVWFYAEGTCYYTVTLTIDSGRVGDVRVVATESGDFEVRV